MLTPSQIRWAASHDWFHADNLDGTITIVDRCVTSDGVLHEVFKIWDSGFKALRDWAGY